MLKFWIVLNVIILSNIQYSCPTYNALIESVINYGLKWLNFAAKLNIMFKMLFEHEMTSLLSTP